MKGIKKILNKYRWDIIGVWTTILTGCFGTLICVGMLVVSGCNRASARQSEEKQAQVTAKPFTLPAIPEAMTDPAERAVWLSLHYWDHFAFGDTTLIHKPEITEQAFVDFAVVLPHAGEEKAREAINALLSKAEKEETGRMYKHFLDLSDKYLYDPNSPVRNEELYIPVAEYILNDSRSDELERIRPAYRLEMMRKNRVGEIARGVAYTLPNGKSGRLFDINSDYTVLYFNNPDCHMCREITRMMNTSQTVNSLLDNGTLSVLAFYPDEDLTAWRKHLADMPSKWINAYDKGAVVSRMELYDLKAIPTLYLLDRDKRVVLKDVDFMVLEAWLANRFFPLPQ